MTPDFISRIVNLVRTQGDRIMLADSATGKAVVIMDLDQYERLFVEPGSAAVVTVPTATTVPAARQPYASAPTATPLEPRVEAPFRAPELVTKREASAPPEEPQKIAKHSDNPFKKRAVQLGVQQTPEPQGLRDLTQAELLDKINRDIGDWKTAQERKRADELTSVARRAPRIDTESKVEEEERFYLEPIE